jgi:carboxyl-terminal processing protease
MMKNRGFWKGFSAGVCVSALLLTAVVLFTTVFGIADWNRAFIRKNGAFNASYEKKVQKVEDYIRDYYLDKVDNHQMEDEVCRAILSGLGDKYAAYYNAKDYQAMNETTSGTYVGIGAYVSQNATTKAIVVEQVIQGGPAWKAGIKNKDVICQINQKMISGLTLDQVISKMRGKAGTKVELGVWRNKSKTVLKYILTREKIEAKTVMGRMLDEKIGYIAVSSFEAITPKQFQNALDSLEKKQEKALIIDLRNNGGGLLDSAVKMLNDMLPKGLVVYTEDKNGKSEEFYSSGKKSFGKPVVILVNGNTASASEIFSGAMQDKKKAVLLGTKTYGKGIVQTIFPLNDGSAIKFTTQKYYTPNGQCIHGKGLVPDVMVALKKGGYRQKVSKIFVDYQMQKAISYLLHKEK